MKEPEWKTLLRGLLSAAALGCLAARVIRVAAHWQSVAPFYGVGVYGAGWSFVGLLLFAGPFLTALTALAGLWLRRDWAGRVSLAALGVSGFFALEEGLTLFARTVNGNGGYVGSEPLLSAAVCVISGAGLLLSRGRKA